MTVYIISSGRKEEGGQVNCVMVDDIAATHFMDAMLSSEYYGGPPWVMKCPNEDTIIVANDSWWIKKEHWIVS